MGLRGLLLGLQIFFKKRFAIRVPFVPDRRARRSCSRHFLDQRHTRSNLEVIPAYNEADVIAEFNTRLANVRVNFPERSEVIYINDGSRDNTFAILRSLRERDPTI